MTPARVIGGAALVLALGVGVVAWRVSLLPAPLPPAARPSGLPEVRVAYHIHTNRSDGTGTVDEIASAAADAGLDVVILTDHGDGTRQPIPPHRVGGVLVIEGVEISSWAGHYVALGARASPFPLGGVPETVVDDVARLGGYGIVAHPGSAKDDLKWRDWDAPFPAIEWLNADSEWRDRPRRLWDAVVTYPWAPVATITALLDRPVFELAQWDRHAAMRPVSGLAAYDAHARIGLRGVGEPYDGTVALRLPGYRSMFRAFSNVVGLDREGWGEDARRDAEAVLDALKAGRAYTVLTGYGDGRVVTFGASSGGVTAGMGEHLVPSAPVTVTAETDAPSTATTTLVCDGRPVASAAGARLTWTTTSPPGACRLEVALGAAGSHSPWIVTNPIYIRSELRRGDVSRVLTPQVTVPIAASGERASWVPEADPGSSATVEAVTGRAGRLEYRWQLGPAGSAQFAAIRLPTPSDLATFDRVVLRAFADRPMRVWLQLRTPADGGHRWGTSIYLDETPRQLTLPFARFLSIDRRAGATVPLDQVTALLLVTDTVHARPGQHGTVTFDELWLAR